MKQQWCKKTLKIKNTNFLRYIKYHVEKDKYNPNHNMRKN